MFCSWFLPCLQECRLLYLEYAALEEAHGLAKHAMDIYERATRAVPKPERAQVYDIYVTRASDFFGIAKVRRRVEAAHGSGQYRS